MEHRTLHMVAASVLLAGLLILSAYSGIVVHSRATLTAEEGGGEAPPVQPVEGVAALDDLGDEAEPVEPGAPTRPESTTPGSDRETDATQPVAPATDDGLDDPNDGTGATEDDPNDGTGATEDDPNDGTVDIAGDDDPTDTAGNAATDANDSRDIGHTPGEDDPTDTGAIDVRPAAAGESSATSGDDRALVVVKDALTGAAAAASSLTGPAAPTSATAPDEPTTTAESLLVEAHDEPDDRVDADHGGHLPPGVTIMVNGRSITGHEGEDSGPKLEGCAITVEVTGLEPTTTVAVDVVAVTPTAPHGQEVPLVSGDPVEADSTGSVTVTYPMDELVSELQRKPNGYHLRVEVSIAGAPVASKIYWLACGAAQTGEPTRLLFAVEWITAGGNVLAAPLDAHLPDGWRDFWLEASSRIGEATCAYPEGDDTLVCSYDNPGHGTAPGLVVPGSPRATYTVGVGGIPEGWLVQAATVGDDFVGRETCPRGGGGHDSGGHDGGDHESRDIMVVAHEPDGVGDACVHTVRIGEQPLRPTSVTTATPTTAPPAPTPTVTTRPPVTEPPAVLAVAVVPQQPPPVRVTSAPADMAVTGTDTAPVVATGVLLVALGVVTLGLEYGRRRAEA